MKKGKNYIAWSVVFMALCTYLLLSTSNGSNAEFYDNTSIVSKVNISNLPPEVFEVTLYKGDDGEQSSIDLTEGTTELIICNATVEDFNGNEDIVSANATIYDASSFNSSSGTDNNYNYFQGACTNETVNSTALKFSCSFDVWYYANNATWNCNISTKDTYDYIGTGVDLTPPTFNSLVALNLSSTELDFGNMDPATTTVNANEPSVNITNTGNINFNVSVDGYGDADGDGYAMVCQKGNIPIANLKYNVTSGQDFTDSMTSLTDTALNSGIPDYSIPNRVDDGDTAKVNTTNTTYWKLEIPVNGAAGYCNGTITFSAVV